jgi:Zn-dependent protease with chaperone function
MRWWLMIFMSMASCLQAAAAEGIEQVLERSQQMRIAQRPAADARSDAAQRVRDSLQRLCALGRADAPAVELVLVGGELFAEALLDRSGIAVSQTVGELPEGERLLLLAHELGHVRMAHARALKALYRQHIPGEVRPETTEPAAAALGAQAHVLSHRHELEADAYAYTLVRSLGLGIDNAFALLTRQGMQHDSATHPGTRRRIAQLRMLEASLAQQAVNPADAQAIAVAWAQR